MTAIDEKLLEERLTALESARAWSPRLVSKLESHIRSASDAELLRINPMRFAAEKGLAEDGDDRSLPARRGARPLRDELDPALPDLLLRDRQLPGAQESQQPLPLHQLPRRSRGCARRHDRGHLHGEPGHPPDRLSRSRDAFGRGLHLPLPDGGGGADPGRHALRQDEADADPGAGLSRTGRDDDAGGDGGAGRVARQQLRRRRRDSCSSSIPRFRPPSSASQSAATSIPARRTAAPLRRAR